MDGDIVCLIHDSQGDIMPKFLYVFEMYLDLPITEISGCDPYRLDSRNSVVNRVRDMGADSFGIRA